MILLVKENVSDRKRLNEVYRQNLPSESQLALHRSLRTNGYSFVKFLYPLVITLELLDAMQCEMIDFQRSRASKFDELTGFLREILVNIPSHYAVRTAFSFLVTLRNVVLHRRHPSQMRCL